MTFDYSDDYAIKFGDYTESVFEERVFANDLINSWQQLIQMTESGYSFCLEEFIFDVTEIRGGIEQCIIEKSLLDFQDHKIFIENIQKLDLDFISVTQKHPSWINFTEFSWWEKRVPKKVTKDFFETEIEEESLKKEGLQFDIIK